jgi:hypothetical protein
MRKKSKGQFFIDAHRNVHLEKENGLVVRGVHYPDRKNRPMQLMFRISGDGQFLVLMRKGLPWTAAPIRKDAWVTRILDPSKVIPEQDKDKFGYIF